MGVELLEPFAKEALAEAETLKLGEDAEGREVPRILSTRRVEELRADLLEVRTEGVRERGGEGKEAVPEAVEGPYQGVDDPSHR